MLSKREKKINMFEIRKNTEISVNDMMSHFKEHEGKTIGDYIADMNEDWLESIIKSGQLFKIDIYDLVDLMGHKNKMLLFERIDELSIIDLIVDYQLDAALVKEWLERYGYYRVLLKLSNKQFTYRSNTNEQIILYYYLKNLGIIDLDAKLPDAVHQSNLLSFLLNRGIDNIRRALRDANIRDKEKKYYTQSALKHIIELAEETGFSELKDKVQADLKRLYNKWGHPSLHQFLEIWGRG